MAEPSSAGRRLWALVPHLPQDPRRPQLPVEVPRDERAVHGRELPRRRPPADATSSQPPRRRACAAARRKPSAAGDSGRGPGRGRAMPAHQHAGRRRQPRAVAPSVRRTAGRRTQKDTRPAGAAASTRSSGPAARPARPRPARPRPTRRAGTAVSFGSLSWRPLVDQLGEVARRSRAPRDGRPRAATAAVRRSSATPARGSPSRSRRRSPASAARARPETATGAAAPPWPRRASCRDPASGTRRCGPPRSACRCGESARRSCERHGRGTLASPPGRPLGPPVWQAVLYLHSGPRRGEYRVAPERRPAAPCARVGPRSRARPAPARSPATRAPPSPAGPGTRASRRSASSSSRAAVPIRLIISPPRPMRIGFCDSRSTRMLQASAQSRSRSRSRPRAPRRRGRRRRAPPPRTASMTTAVENGSSSAGGRQHLLAHQLGRDAPLGLVGQVVLGEERLALRQVPARTASSVGHAVAGPGRRPGRCRRRRSCAWNQAIRGSSAGLATRSILLSTRTTGCATPSSRSSTNSVALARRLRRVDDHARRRRRPRMRLDGGVHHADVQPVQRPVDAGRVDEDHLRRRVVFDAEDAGPRRLRLVRDDGHLAADQRVQQRRLAGVGPADERDVTAALVMRSASVSHPLPGFAPGIWSRTRITGRCTRRADMTEGPRQSRWQSSPPAHPAAPVSADEPARLAALAPLQPCSTRRPSRRSTTWRAWPAPSARPPIALVSLVDARPAVPQGRSRPGAARDVARRRLLRPCPRRRRAADCARRAGRPAALRPIRS